jgi:hypothetical protein
VLYFQNKESNKPKGGFVLGPTSSGICDNYFCFEKICLLFCFVVARSSGVLSIGSVKSYSGLKIFHFILMDVYCIFIFNIFVLVCFFFFFLKR